LVVGLDIAFGRLYSVTLASTRFLPRQHYSNHKAKPPAISLQSTASSGTSPHPPSRQTVYARYQLRSQTAALQASHRTAWQIRNPAQIARPPGLLAQNDGAALGLVASKKQGTQDKEPQDDKMQDEQLQDDKKRDEQ